MVVKGVLGTSENGDELPLALTEVALIAGKQHCYHYRYQYHHQYDDDGDDEVDDDILDKRRGVPGVVQCKHEDDPTPSPLLPRLSSGLPSKILSELDHQYSHPIIQNIIGIVSLGLLSKISSTLFNRIISKVLLELDNSKLGSTQQQKIC